ncbi:MAG: DNA-binding protein, partial [Micrococcales bacterium]|nr:DNA-binding protein [Micrococcales bacterium]
EAYLDDQVEQTRRMALWHQSQTASFPELWGTGAIRNPD